MLKDNSFIKNWLHKLSVESVAEGLITEAGWKLLGENLTEKTYNTIIDELEIKLNDKKAEINKQIDEAVASLQNKKIK